MSRKETVPLVAREDVKKKSEAMCYWFGEMLNSKHSRRIWSIYSQCYACAFRSAHTCGADRLRCRLRFY